MFISAWASKLNIASLSITKYYPQSIIIKVRVIEKYFVIWQDTTKIIVINLYHFI